MNITLFDVIQAGRALPPEPQPPPRVYQPRLGQPLDLDIPTMETPRPFLSDRVTVSAGEKIVLHAGNRVKDENELAYGTLKHDAVATVLGNVEAVSSDGLMVSRMAFKVSFDNGASLTDPARGDWTVARGGHAEAPIAASFSFPSAVSENGVSEEETKKDEGWSTGAKVALGLAIAGGAVLVIWLISRK